MRDCTLSSHPLVGDLFIDSPAHPPPPQLKGAGSYYARSPSEEGVHIEGRGLSD